MVLSAAVQALKSAEELKQKVIAENPNPTSPSKTLCVAQLQKAYQNILLMDLDFALDRKVEQELWNFGFKNQIEFLQNCAKDKKNSRRAESQTLLSWVLQSATGFYICLLHQICNTFKIELPFRCDFVFVEDHKNYEFSIKPPQIASCWYIIQHCLVHLGDLARYNRQVRRADSFYRQALNVSPRNGQPYNQLGLLRAARGDKLGAAYYHARSIAVGGPFPPASNNLARTLASASCHNTILKKKHDSPDLDNSELCFTARLNSRSYINNYIIVHHQLQSGTDLSNTSDSITELNSTLIALVATDEFNHSVLIKMCCLDLYALYSITDNYRTDFNSLSEDERMIYSLLMKLIAGSLTALLLPAHTRASEELVSYSALPAIKLLFEWIRLQPNVLKEQAFVSRPQLWPGLCTLLNNLQEFVKDFDYEKYETLPLPEDEELQGFLPIDNAFSKLKFNENSLCKQITKKESVEIGEPLTPEQINAKMADVLQEHFILKKKSWNFSISETEPEIDKGPDFFNRLRTYRLIKIGEWLSTHFKDNGLDIFSFSFDAEKEYNIFTPIQNSLENLDVLKTIKQLSLLREKRLNEVNSQNTPSINLEDDGDGSDSENKNENSTKDNLDDDVPSEGINPPAFIISEVDIKEKVLEKRAGILKPQGSLEKARCEKALSRSRRIDVVSPETSKLSNETTVDNSDIQDTGSSSSTVSQDGTICSDIGSLLDPPLLPNEKINIKKEGKKVRTNVAMQTIMKKQEESSKQVKFLTPATTPDSSNENIDTSPSENKSQPDAKKIIQPKVLKSLNSLPTDRKTGGILSLKDKSAGYPHLVNIDASSQHENDPAENSENSNPESNSKVVEQSLPKDPDVQKPKINPKYKPMNKIDLKKHGENQENPSTFKQMAYSPWSDGNSGKMRNDSGMFPPAQNLEYNNWKVDHNFPNPPINQNNPGCYSYFPPPTVQKMNSGIPLPVVNPKEIDVRSASMQRQKNPQIPFDNNQSKYNYYSNVQYDNNMFNCWNSFENNPNPMMRDENVNKPNNLPPRLMNYKNPGVMYNPQSDKNYINTPDNRKLNENPITSPSKNWWKPIEPKQLYNQQPLPPNIPNFPPPPQMVQNPANFNYHQGGQKPPIGNPQAYNKYDEEFTKRPPHSLPTQPMGYNNPANVNFNPYNQQPNYNPIMYPQYGNSLMMQQNIQTPIGSEFLRNNPEAYRITQNLNIKNAGSGNVAYMSDAHKQNAAKDNAQHNFNADIPEFIPRSKPAPGGPSLANNPSASGNSSTYSLFNSTEASWQSKNPNENVSHQASWIGSGPSPLERLLEQQKQFKYPPTDS